jgi:thioredoxin reductase (NADPH)
MQIYDVAVIGAGSAGVMAALRAVLNNDTCLLFSGSPQDKKRSRALWVKKVENMPAHFDYRRGIEDPNAEALKWISESDFKHNLQHLRNIGVTRLEKKDELFEILDSKGVTHRARFVILCTGVMDVQPLIQNSIEPVFPFANAQTIDYCLRCDGHHVKDKKTVVIGHDNSAAWVAIMLHERYGSPLTICLHGELPKIEADTKELLDLYQINVIKEKIIEITGDVKSGKLEGFVFDGGHHIAVEMGFVSLGMIVYSELAKSLGADLDERGFVKTTAQGLSSIEGFYVAGDVMAGTKKQIYTAWDTAVNAADAINQKLRSARRATKLAAFRDANAPRA